MRVAILSAEAVPYSKTGGLGDVAGALPKALKRQGADAFLITPCYLQTKGDLLWHRAVDDLTVEWRGETIRCGAFYSEAGGAPTFLIDSPRFFHRDSVYGYREDHERFAFFSKAALELLKRIGAPPDIIHLNDWHTGFAAVEIANRRRWDDYFKNVRTVFSIHNLAYQGVFDAEELWKLGYGEEWQTSAFIAGNGAANAMKAGLTCADYLSTVSRRYSYETQTPEQGYGLDWLLRERGDRYFGVTNGVDYEEWNPAIDKYLPAHFDANHLEGKKMCKHDLLRTLGLPQDLERPVFGWVSRLTAQKGFDLLKTVAFEIVLSGSYFVALGSGAEEYENFLQALRDYAPYQVGVYKGYSEPLAHKIEAGADIFLMPSQFEPCGLNQMYSLRYGTVPIVRATGGLDDTVQEFDRVAGTGNGFKFKNYNANEFLDKIYEALYAYAEPETWRKIQQNGMRVNNSWESAANNYLRLYQMAAGS